MRRPFVGLVVACSTSRLLDVNAPNAVPVTVFDSPAAASLMVISAIGDFECAFGSAVTVEGIISDELADSQLGAAQWPYDRRDANTQTNGIYGTSGCASNQGPGIYTPLVHGALRRRQRAREARRVDRRAGSRAAEAASRR